MNSQIQQLFNDVYAIQDKPEPRRIKVMDVDMPFISMVGFMVKWAIASIPAIIILVIIGFFVSAFFTVFLATLVAS